MDWRWVVFPGAVSMVALALMRHRRPASRGWVLAADVYSGLVIVGVVALVWAFDTYQVAWLLVLLTFLSPAGGRRPTPRAGETST